MSKSRSARGKADDEARAKAYAGHMRYGISEIDTNFELKQFIMQHSERRLNVKNKLHNDIKHFMEDLSKLQQTGTSN